MKTPTAITIHALIACAVLSWGYNIGSRLVAATGNIISSH